MKKTLAIVGAGSRGRTVYGTFAKKNPELFQVVAVAEPREWQREECAGRHGARAFSHWSEMLEEERIADAVVIATQDRDHVAPALAFLSKGYDVLLEKPMDVTPEGCAQIVATARENGCILRVAHVMRYTPYYSLMREIIEGGALGQIANLRHLEPVLFWHQAHSFVRGNWRRSDESAPMILAKSCHDMDLMLFLLGQHCRKIASFGNLIHFRPESAPPNAAMRCLDCPLETTCPYSASAFYLSRFDAGERGWPLDVVSPEVTREGLLRALREGPYGRCVYHCDNDVVDHQVVALEFGLGITATFTMTAFTASRHRETEVLGSHGQLRGDGRTVRLTCFSPPGRLPDGAVQENGEWVWQIPESEGTHGGGDDGLMFYLHETLNDREKALRTTDPEQALESHLMAFAAETARVSGDVVQLS